MKLHIILIIIRRLFISIFSIIIILISLPIKLLFYFVIMIKKHNTKLIILDSKSLGDIIYALSIINRIDEKTILSVETKFFNFTKQILSNKKIVIINHIKLNIKNMIKYKISSIVMPPLNIYENKFRSIFLIYFSWKYSIAIASPLSISHTTLLERIMTIVMLIFSTTQIIKWTLKTNIYIYNRNKVNIYSITIKFLEKHFSLKEEEITNNHITVNEKYILVNMYGASSLRRLPIYIINKILEECILKNTVVKFIGIRENEFKLVKYLQKKYSNINIRNLILKTSIDDIPLLIKNALLVITVQTSIAHIAHILNKKVFVWLEWHSKKPSKNSLHWELSTTKFWNWHNKYNVTYINSQEYLIDSVLKKNNSQININDTISRINSILKNDFMKVENNS